MTSRLTSHATYAALFITLLVPAAVSAQGSAFGNRQIFEAIGARDGSTVCEMGAGDGELTLAVARIVGAAGRVYASELGDDRVRTLREKVARSRLEQITVIAGDQSRTNFPDGGCDAVFMRSVYHHFADPPTMNASIAAALKPGGSSPWLISPHRPETRPPAPPIAARTACTGLPWRHCRGN